MAPLLGLPCSAAATAALLCVAVAVASTLADAAPSAHAPRLAEVNRARALQSGWASAGVPAPTSPVTMHLAIKHRPEDEAAATALFWRVSDPDDELYTQYLTPVEVARLLPPVPEAMDAAVQWLQDNGMPFEVTGTGDVLRVKTTVAAMELALGVSIEVFEHGRESLQLGDCFRATVLRTVDPVGIPPALEGHVDFVRGLSSFPTGLGRGAKPATSKGTPVTPKQEKALYQITEEATAKSLSSQGVLALLKESFWPSDLAQFEKQYGLPPQEIRHVKGINATVAPCGESTLDVQCMVTTGTGVPTDFLLDNIDYFSAFMTILNDTNSALVWSLSYGGDLDPMSVAEVQRLDREFQKFGLVGKTVLASSGDGGAYDDGDEAAGAMFHVSYPSALPSVTSVGATQLTDGVEDTGANFSGGGFTPSKYFTMANATWQKEAVSAYFTNAPQLPPQHLYNRDGIAQPDVSAVGVNIGVVQNHTTLTADGTSASCPLVAGIVGLINDKLLAAGKKPLGFVNPFFYKNPGAFHDILKGFNQGPFPANNRPAFSAAKGWDPVTGLGTPNYEKLKAAALAAQS